jgi:hypothetical protein
MLKLILIVTICAPNLSTMENAYTRALNFSVVERGAISSSLASVWAAPKMKGHAYTLMRSPDGQNFYLRFVQLDETPSYRPLSTFGWNALALSVVDPEAAAAKIGSMRLEESKGLPGDSIQVVGPAHEVWVFTRAESAAASSIRMFLGTPDLPMTQRYFRERLSTKPMPVEAFQMKAKRRPQRKDELASAVSVVSFETPSLESVRALLIAPPKRIKGVPYNGRRVGALRGTALEIIEVIESP